MPNEEITENVLNIIAILKHDFEKEIFFKYNGYSRDFESFYCNGHCVSFAIIIEAIFGGDFYDDFTYLLGNIGHVIIKIQNHFYNSTGIVDYLVDSKTNNFTLIDKKYFPYFKEIYYNKDEHSEEIEKELIDIGKKALRKIEVNHSHNM